jgi:hypothetical protein
LPGNSFGDARKSHEVLIFSIERLAGQKVGDLKRDHL